MAKTDTPTRATREPRADWDGFLAALRKVPVTRYACQAVGVSRASAYARRKERPEFAALWNDALEEGNDRAEETLFAVALGTWQPADPNDEPPSVEALKLWLRAKRADEFALAIKVKTEASLAALRAMTPDERLQLGRELGVVPED